MFLEICQIKKSFGTGDSRVEVLKGIQLSVDGQAVCEMRNHEEISISRSPHDALLIRFDEQRNYFSLLKDKLSQWSL